MQAGARTQISRTREGFAASPRQFGPANSHGFGLAIRTAFVVTVLVLSLSACDIIGDDDFPLEGTNVSMTEIAGNWIAFGASFIVESTGPIVGIDLLADAGSVNMSIQDDGRFTLTIGDGTGETSVTAGQLGFDDEWLVAAFDESPDDPEYFVINFTNEVLNISGPGEFDVNEDSLEDPGIFEFFFNRS